MNKKGFSYVELMVALPLVLVTLSVVWGTYITMQKLFPGGITQVALQSYGRSAMGRVADNVRQATAASVNADGDILTITFDPLHTYSDQTDDITAQYSVVGPDIVYDPDTAVANNESNILGNVTTEAGIPYFQKFQDLIVITYRVTSTSVLFGTQNCSLSTTIKMRSSDG